MKSRSLVFVGLLAGICLSINQTAHATTRTWSGATSNAMSNSGNWDTLPVTLDSFTFTSATGAGGLNLNNNLTSSGFSVAGITFNAGATAFVIGDGTTNPNVGNTFVLTGNVANSGTNLETINNPFSMTAARTFTMTASGGDITLGGNISGTGGGITTGGNGTLTLSGTNTYTGNTIVSINTTLTLQGIHNNGASIIIQSANTGTANATMNVNAGASETGVALTMQTTASGTSIQTLNIAGTLTINGAVILAQNPGTVNTRHPQSTVTVSSGGNFNVGSTGGFTFGNNDTSARGTLTIQSGGTVTANNAAQTIILGNGRGNGYINLNGGTLRTSRTIKGGGGQDAVITFDGGTLQALDGNNANWLNPSLNQSAKHIYVRDGGAILDTAGFNMGVTDPIEHDPSASATDGGLTKLGAGTLTLNSAAGSTYTGLTLVNAGTLLYGNNNQIFTGNVTVNGATAIMNLATFSDTVGTVTLDGNGQINSTTGVLTSTGSFEMKSGSASAILAGSVGLNKTTGGTVTLTGANTYTGTTLVSAGKLLVNGSIIPSAGASTLTVAPGATLGGSGVLGSTSDNVNVTIQSGGIVAPGNSPGLLTINGNQIWQNSDVYQWETNGKSFNVPPLGSAGTDYDSITVNGTLDFSAVTAGNLILDIAAYNFADSISPNEQFKLWTYTSLSGWGATPNFAASPLFTLVDGSSGLIHWDQAYVYSDGMGGIWLTGLNTIPEPSVVLLLGLGGLLLFKRRNGNAGYLQKYIEGDTR